MVRNVQGTGGNIFLCDEVSIGQFGKLNLMGLNPGDSLAINETPYHLFSTLVVQSLIGPGEQPSDLALVVQQKDSSGVSMVEEKHQVINFNRDDPTSRLGNL